MNKHLTYINVHMHIKQKPRRTVALTNTVESSILESAYLVHKSQPVLRLWRYVQTTLEWRSRASVTQLRSYIS